MATDDGGDWPLDADGLKTNIQEIKPRGSPTRFLS
jgi:hypothetical protein